MAVEWRATCGTVNESIKCKRADFDDVKKAYDVINMANPNDMNLQETFRKAIIDNGVWRGISSKAAEQKAQEILTQIQNDSYDDSVWQRYALVGGTPLSEYINYKDFFGKSPDYADYSNTCALQVSYALNYGSMPLHTEIKPKEHKSMYGKDKQYLYILGTDYMGSFLNDKWGKAEISETLHNNVDRQAMLTKLKGQKGIATMRGNHFVNNTLVKSFSHTTLWNLDEFVDVQNGTNINFLDEESQRKLFHNTEFYLAQTFNFWELL